tara:strand:+ start:371 stop:1513 length:1143 start_codon:yes stop_codon:yes gene_type:complete
MKVFYWSPFLSNIATVEAVSKSINSILRYDKNKEIEPHLIDATGEWQLKQEKLKNTNIIKLYKNNFYKFLPKGGYFKSRISQIFIFIFSFRKLKRLIIKENPDFLIAHLIISLPLLLFAFFNFRTKLIVRISGTPKLNPIRRFFWSLLSKKIYKVTCPTYSTLNKLAEMNVFSRTKLAILYDPVISAKYINLKKNEPLDKKFENTKFILGIGRLTRQKNFELLIKGYNKILQYEHDVKLLILGEGEERSKIEKLIQKLHLKENVYLLGYKDNVFNYLNRSKCFICSSFYEDPGFVIIEAAFLNKMVFASDSKTGPTEILNNSERGFLFENNNYKDLYNKYIEFTKLTKHQSYAKLIRLKKYSKNFTLFYHYKSLRDILIS